MTTAQPHSPRSTRRSAGWALALSGAAAAALVPAAPASAAAPIVHASYSDAFSFDDEFCGLPVHVERELRESVVLRVARDSDGQAFPVRSTVHALDVVSLADDDPATDEYVVADWTGTFVEQHTTLVSGTVYTFEGVDAGTFSLYDSTGARLVHDRGVRLFTDTFDSLGDGEPGGIYLDSVAVPHGPRLTEEEFCGILVGQLT